MYTQEQKQKVLDSINIVFTEKLDIEYGTKKFDFNTFIKEKTDEVLLPEMIDTMTLGETEVVYKVEKEGYTKKYPIKVTVKDTKGAVILFNEDAVSLAYGAEFDIKSNISSVKDPIDGDVPYAEKAGENNYYIIEGSVDTSTAGDYTITVKAKDKNGTASEKAYTVNVAEEYVAPVYEQGYTAPTGNYGYQAPATDYGYQAPASGDGYTSCTFEDVYINGKCVRGTAPAEGTCDMTPQGMAYEDAIAWGKQQQFDENGPNYMRTPFTIPIINNCGDVVGYKVSWDDR